MPIHRLARPLRTPARSQRASPKSFIVPAIPAILYQDPRPSRLLSSDSLSAREAAARRRAALLVVCCTVSGAVAQILMKIGAAQMQPNLWAIVSNLWLMGGYALYGLNTLLLVLALREGELSMLYPIIALTYVWVTLLSYTLLHETPHLLKNLGIGCIVAGVAVLGSGRKP